MRTTHCKKDCSMGWVRWLWRGWGTASGRISDCGRYLVPTMTELPPSVDRMTIGIILAVFVMAVFHLFLLIFSLRRLTAQESPGSSTQYFSVLSSFPAC